VNRKRSRGRLVISCSEEKKGNVVTLVMSTMANVEKKRKNKKDDLVLQ